MAEKQLNVWIPEELKCHVAERAEQEKRGMNAIIADLIRHDIAQRKSHLIEQNSLTVVIRDIVASELRQAHIQLRQDLEEDRDDAIEFFGEWLKKHLNRLTALLIKANRSSSMVRMLIYASLSKAYGVPFAQNAYYEARERVKEELLLPQGKQQAKKDE